MVLSDLKIFGFRRKKPHLYIIFLGVIQEIGMSASFHGK